MPGRTSGWWCTAHPHRKCRLTAGSTRGRQTQAQGAPSSRDGQIPIRYKVETCQQLPIEKSALDGRAFMAVTAATPAVRVRARRTRNSARYEHNVKQRVVVTGKTEDGYANSRRRQNSEKNLSPNKHGSTRLLSSKSARCSR